MGDTDIARQLDPGAAGDTRICGGLTYGYAASDTIFAGSKAVPTPGGEYSLALQLLTLSAGADLPTGTGVGVVLPTARILRHDAERTATDMGLGDLELRLRQEVMRFFGFSPRSPRLVISAGLAAPTGPYIGKSTVADSTTAPAVAPDTRYSSLGRGVWWLLTDIEAFGRITDRFGWYAALWTRWPTGDASNGFHWGSEQRLSVAASVARLGLDRLTGSLGVEWQRRDRASEVLLGERKPFLNGGGDWVDLVPTLRSDIAGGFSAVLSSRIPLSRNVVGLQGVQNVSYFFGIQFSMGTRPSAQADATPQPVMVGAPPSTPEIGELVREGVVTVVDYTATWCPPCQKLGAELDLHVAVQPGVVVQRVDATNWLQPEMDRFLPGCAGLPVLDVYGRDGRLVARLVGPDAFAYAAPVSDALAVAVPTAASATSAVE